MSFANDIPEQEEEDLANWDEEMSRLQETRQKRGFFEVSPEETDYRKVVSEARGKLENMCIHQHRVSPRSDAQGNPELCRCSAVRGKLAATMISNISGQEGQQHQNHIDHVTTKGK